MPPVASPIVSFAYFFSLFETALVFGFTPPECHMWKKKLGLFLLFRLFLLRLKSATVVNRPIYHQNPPFRLKNRRTFASFTTPSEGGTVELLVVSKDTMGLPHFPLTERIRWRAAIKV